MYEEEVAYIAFTGKASEVLREKGCPNAQTAHRLLYYSKQMPNGKFVYKPRPHIETTSGDTYLDVPIDYNSLLTGKKTFTPQQEYYLNKRKDNPPLPIEFNYGYAITTHRAQGSQWDNVLVIEENFPFDKEEHARWLYTACTRAAKKLTLILKK